ncbi:putative cytochrome c1 heme lyase [Yarrowia sp. B02]|nr:putative cytochrome c1 heme lyase [Yarrowia sp. B02]
MSDEKCPVDHESRKVWARKLEQSTENAENAEKCPVDHSKMKQTEQTKPETCPVDHKTTQTTQTTEKETKTPSETCPVDHNSREVWAKRNVASHGSAASVDIEPYGNGPVDEPNTGLDQQREISTIPRAGSDSNWVYPSQQQFFNAMKRKQWDPQAEDMQSIVPIHNAVNERAWFEIQRWEGKLASQCGGPKLVSFQGDSKKLTPKARFNNWFLGYQKPFDRHDWTVDRCGTKIDYVIDFYEGKQLPGMIGMPSFYLDVRPKINSFEGVRMRVANLFGFK